MQNSKNRCTAWGPEAPLYKVKKTLYQCPLHIQHYKHHKVRIDTQQKIIDFYMFCSLNLILVMPIDQEMQYFKTEKISSHLVFS